MMLCGNIYSGDWDTTSYGAVIGGIAGVAMDNTKITLCKNAGGVYPNCYKTYTENSGAVGGISGLLYNSSVEQCFNIGTISSKTIELVLALGNSGGVIGYGYNFILKNSYNLGGIVGNTRIGGVIGAAHNSGTINNCYSASGDLTFNSSGGGLAGYTANTKGANVSWNSSFNPIGEQSGCTWSNYASYTKTQMQTLNSGLLTILTTGDGAGLWEQKTGVNDGFPYLVNNKP